MHTAKRAFVVCTYNHPCVLNMVSKNRLVNPEGKKEKIQCYFRYCAITLYMYIYIYVFGNIQRYMYLGTAMSLFVYH